MQCDDRSQISSKHSLTFNWIADHLWTRHRPGFSGHANQKTGFWNWCRDGGVTALTHLVECDELSVQAHQVAGLRHLAHHEGDEGGVTLPLFPSKRRLGQQHAGVYGVFN